jgi:hypothetical protein
MTKKELLDILKVYPDDSEIRICYSDEKHPEETYDIKMISWIEDGSAIDLCNEVYNHPDKCTPETREAFREDIRSMLYACGIQIIYPPEIVGVFGETPQE